MGLVRLDFLTKIDKIHANRGIYIQIVSSVGGFAGLHNEIDQPATWYTSDGSLLPFAVPAAPVILGTTAKNVANSSIQKLLALQLNQVLSTQQLPTQYYLYALAQALPSIHGTLIFWPNSTTLWGAVANFIPPPPPAAPILILSPYFYVYNDAASAITYSNSGDWFYLVSSGVTPPVFKKAANKIIQVDTFQSVVESFYLYRAGGTKGQTLVTFTVQPVTASRGFGDSLSYLGSATIRTFKSDKGTIGAHPQGQLLFTGGAVGGSGTDFSQPTTATFLVDNVTGRIRQVS